MRTPLTTKLCHRNSYRPSKSIASPGLHSEVLSAIHYYHYRIFLGWVFCNRLRSIFLFHSWIRFCTTRVQDISSWADILLPIVHRQHTKEHHHPYGLQVYLGGT